MFLLLRRHMLACFTRGFPLFSDCDHTACLLLSRCASRGMMRSPASLSAASRRGPAAPPIKVKNSRAACSLWNRSGSLRLWTAGWRTLTMTELGTTPASAAMVHRLIQGQGDVPCWDDQLEAAGSLLTMWTGVPAYVLNS